MFAVSVQSEKQWNAVGDSHLTRIKAALVGEPEIEWPPLPTTQYFFSLSLLYRAIHSKIFNSISIIF